MTETPGLNVAGLQEWLHRTHPDLAAGDLSATVIAGGRSNLTYAVDGARIPLIVRRPPLGHVLSSAHDMRREHRVISALSGGALPVPTAVDVVDDTRAGAVTGTFFFVMERAPGRILRDPAANEPFTAAGLRALSVQLATALADLHAIEPDAVGLADFGRPERYLQRQLSTWRRQLDASRSREVTALEELQESLEQHVPRLTRAAIVHGDYRLDNALVTGAGSEPSISAILDWEMAALGDPLVDLGMLAVYWEIAEIAGAHPGVVPSAVDPAAGYLGVDELVAVYAERSGASELPDLGWYRAFAAYKLAVILEGIHFRFLGGATVGDGFEHIGELVEPLARQGLAVR